MLLLPENHKCDENETASRYVTNVQFHHDHNGYYLVYINSRLL